MEVTVTDKLVELFSPKLLKEVGLNKEQVRWNGVTLRLTNKTNAQIAALRAGVAEIVATERAKAKAGAEYTPLKGASKLLSDLDTWIAAAKQGADATKCKSSKQFAALAFETIQKACPNFRLYSRVASGAEGVWHAFYVGDIDWTERQERHGQVYPAHADITLYYIELGKLESTRIEYRDHEVRGLTVWQALANENYIPETPELNAAYEKSTARYNEIFDKVGKQFLASGVGSDKLDDVLTGKDSESSWRWHSSNFEMVRDGQPSRVVIDKRREGEQKNEKEDDYPALDFWRGKSYLEADEDEDPEDIRPEDSNPDGDEPFKKSAPVPVRHIVPVFDLSRHIRLRVHTDNLEEYVYDRTMGAKLVLPPEQRYFIRMMLEHEGGFTDIVKGKGGGAIICCAGVAGSGKTLTAEVYGETMGRPLYSVQCSQLGTDPDGLEKALLIVFGRAQRWNAILLLDEADVYVAKRGTDLTQNAIVGVFLRVLEYYSGALFLTTNRGDLIDDAIASRCLARIDYTAPTVPDQIQIWDVLGKAIGVEVPPPVAAAFAAKYPKTTGRDVKNLLKLASLVSKASQKPVNLEMLEYVKKFKPTE